MDKCPVTLCMIVKNEEKSIAHCLNSIQNLVQQIVVVDTGSTDNTVEIAAKFDAEIYHFKWVDNYAAARNFALEQADQQWILHLDADEVFEDESIVRVPALLEEAKAEGFLLNIRNWHPQSDMVKYMDSPQIRLFRNRDEYRYQNRIHEQISYSIAKRGGMITKSALVVNHYGYQTIDLDKMELNSRILEASLEQQPENCYLLYKLGETYKSLGRFPKAKNALIRAEKTADTNLEEENRASLYLRMAQLYLNEDNYRDALTYAQKILRINSKHQIALYIFAIASLYQKRIDEADEAITTLKKVPGTQLISPDDIHKLELVIQKLNQFRN